MVGDPAVAAHNGRDLRLDETGFGHGRSIDEPDAVGEAFAETGSDRAGKRGLADATEACERDQADALVYHYRSQLGQFALAAERRLTWRRKIGAADRLHRRELVITELEQLHLAHVLQTVDAEIAERLGLR